MRAYITVCVLAISLGSAFTEDPLTPAEPGISQSSSNADTKQEDIYQGDLKKIIQPLIIDQEFDQGKLISLELSKRHRDPTTAMVRSMLVPGWGQFYNDKPAKGVLAIVAETTSLALTIYNYSIMHNYDRKTRRAFDLAKKFDEAGDKEDHNFQTKMGEFYDARYNYFTIETEKNLWFFLGSLFLSTLDAYIDAHLSDFDVYDLPRDPNAPSNISVPLFSASFPW